MSVGSVVMYKTLLAKLATVVLIVSISSGYPTHATVFSVDILLDPTQGTTTLSADGIFSQTVFSGTFSSVTLQPINSANYDWLDVHVDFTTPYLSQLWGSTPPADAVLAMQFEVGPSQPSNVCGASPFCFVTNTLWLNQP